MIQGRQYDFYFNGPHLHMVVLRAGGASYWVVNTLLDSMSNETMLAIAKGLQAVPQVDLPRVNAKKPPLGIFGAGWVGLVTGACFADLGHDVVVRDVVPEKIEELNAGRVPFHEPGLAELIERNRERLTFTLDVDELKADARIFFSCVDTPPTPSGDADLGYVWSVIDDLGDPGRGDARHEEHRPGRHRREDPGDARPAGLEHVGYVSNPEFLSEGRAVEDFVHPDRIVIGAFDEAQATGWPRSTTGFDAPSCARASPSAEMIKLASNAFLATRISFINEIANVSEAVGADVDEVALRHGPRQADRDELPPARASATAAAASRRTCPFSSCSPGTAATTSSS